MRKRVKVAIVSYLNTLPFIYGFRNHSLGNNFELIMATPRECAELFVNNEVDISLLPVGVLPNLLDFKIISNYCIGCNGEVRTVCLFYKESIDDVKEIYLDPDSRTSVLLIQILIKKFFKKNVHFIPRPIEDINLHQNPQKAILAIGDKTFELEKIYKKIDLGQSWKDWTSLPFAFAAFVSKKSIEVQIEKELNECLEFGIQHIHNLEFGKYQYVDNLEDYLINNISYDFDGLKHKALNLFLDEVKKL